jgi:hypothetical protein
VTAVEGEPQMRSTVQRKSGQRWTADTVDNKNNNRKQDIRKQNEKNKSIYHIEPDVLSESKEDLMDKMAIFRESIRQGIEYDNFCAVLDCFQIEKLDELIDLMVETGVVKKCVYINGDKIPQELIRQRWEKYEYATMQYVLDSLASCRTKPKNPHKYMLVTLYNAPLTVVNQTWLEIQSDMPEPICVDGG